MMGYLAKPARRLITFTVVAMMMFASLMAPAPIAAQSQSLQSQLTGVTITYGPPYELQADGTFADDFMETMMFLGAADILAMGFMTPLLDLNGARDIMLEALFGEMGTASTIDRGDYTGVSYSLDMLNYDGMEMGVFSLFMNQRSHGYAEFYIFIAPPALFGSTMQTAQNSFTINGTPLMDGVDAMVMGNMITANIGITGGEAVTDVTEVQDQAGQQQTSQPDAGTTATDTTAPSDSAARDEYLGALSAEVQAVDASLSRMIGALADMRDNVIDAQAARAIFDQESVILAGTYDRVSALTPPAGMESFHQEALAWSSAVSQVGVEWNSATAGTGSQDAFNAALTNGVDAHLAFAERLQAEMSVSQGQDSQTTSQTTETSGQSQTTDPGTTDGDAATYIDAVQSHRSEFLDSFAFFNESMGLVTENASEADLEAFRQGTLGEAQNWLAYPSRAQQLTPPAGYESAHQAYITWADDIATLGNLWFDVADGGGEPALNAFFDFIPVVQESDNALQAELTAAGEGNAGAPVGDTGSGTSTTETSTTSSRTTRSSEQTGTDTSGNTSETSGRTSRGSGTSSTTETGTSSETGSRTSRGSGSGSTSESTTSGDTGSRSSRTTRGSDSTTGSGSATTNAANEWQAELNGVTITWGDDVDLNSRRGATTESDPESGQDRIWMETTTPEGVRVEFSVNVVPTNGGDATPLISLLMNDSDRFHGTFGDDAVIVDSVIDPEASAVLIHTSPGAGDIWVYVQVSCVTPSCDSVAMLVVEGEGYPVVDTLVIIDNSVAVDGVSISNAMPPGDIEAAIDGAGN